MQHVNIYLFPMRREPSEKTRLQRAAEVRGLDPRTPDRFNVSSGRLTRPYIVELVGDSLQFRTRGTGRSVALPGDLYLTFMALASATDGEILAFAKRYSVLGICPGHGLPVGHTAKPHLIPLSELVNGAAFPIHYADDCFGPIDANSPGRRWESTEDWRRWARRFRMLYDAASELKDPDSPQTVQKLNLPFLLGWREPSEHRSRSRSGWGDITRSLNTWLLDSGVTPVLVIDGDRKEIELSGEPRHVFAALVLQLLLFVKGSKRIYTCDSCGRDMPARKRAPKTGQGKYCDRADCQLEGKRKWARKTRAKV